MDIAASLDTFWQAVQTFDVNLFIEQYGYWFYAIVFGWTFLEGETFVLFAGAAAAQEILDIRLLILTAWIGSFCGDQLYFYLGRRFGPGIVRRFPKMQPGVDKVSGLIRRNDVAFILGYRFLYGVRNVSSFAMGMIGLEWRKFAFWNFIAAFIWAVTFSMTGFLFGEALDHMMDDTVEFAMIGLAGLIAFALLFKWGLKKLSKKIERAK
jgi:membrane protein DedA with SNARE-associated domain